MHLKSFKKEFNCEICQKVFSTNYKLTRHKTTHSESRNFTCSICMRVYKTRDVLVKHSRTHETDIGPYFCSICNEEFKYRSGLNHHFQLSHAFCEKKSVKPQKVSEEVYKCETCYKTFKRKNNFLRHEFVHGDKTFECLFDGCGKKFKTTYDRNKHRKLHQEIFFDCTFCTRK